MADFCGLRTPNQLPRQVQNNAGPTFITKYLLLIRVNARLPYLALITKYLLPIRDNTRLPYLTLITNPLPFLTIGPSQPFLIARSSTSGKSSQGYGSLCTLQRGTSSSSGSPACAVCLHHCSRAFLGFSIHDGGGMRCALSLSMLVHFEESPCSDIRTSLVSTWNAFLLWSGRLSRVDFGSRTEGA